MTEALTLRDVISDLNDDDPCIITIMAEGGLGKTTLGAMFPRPIFLQFEKGTEAVKHNKDIPEEVRKNIRILPLIERVGQELEYIKMLGTEDHPFKTLVVDTVSAANVLYEQHVIACDEKKPRSINQANGGYGAGHAATADLHRILRANCERLREKKRMNIVFLCHVDMETIELPDKDPYMRYSLCLNKKSQVHYTNNVDMVGHLKLQAYTHGDGDRKKVTSTQNRELYCMPDAASPTKNRYGITETIIVENGTNPLIEYIPYLQEKNDG